MLIYPAIDLYEGKAVRLFKGRYDEMTIYSNDPPAIARDFAQAGATRIHAVDLEGAKDATMPNFETVLAIKRAADEAVRAKCAAEGRPIENAFVEIGGGIRTDEAIAAYLLLKRSVAKYGERIAVGIDVRDGYVAISGWTELSEYRLGEFAQMMQDIGVRTIICTDISKDGAMKGTNRELYRELSETLDIDITASGGVSTIEDVEALAQLGIHGAIIGKAYYTGAIDLAEAVRIGEEK